MKLVRALGVALLVALTITACDDAGDSTGVEIADLAGFWTASQFEYVDDTGSAPGFSIDAVVDTSGAVTLDINEGGTFSGTLDIPGLTAQAVPIGGTISLIDSETLTIVPDAQTGSYGLSGDLEYTLTDRRLTFVNDGMSFDFPDDIELRILGVARGEVAATLAATFER